MTDKYDTRIEIYDHEVIKRQPKALTDREFSALIAMYDTRFVPRAQRIDEETIVMERLFNESVTDKIEFTRNCSRFLIEIERRGLRHGDLTSPHVFVVNNRPVVIDWSECRWNNDPLPDKRPEGDRYWLGVVRNKLIGIDSTASKYMNLRAGKMINFIHSALADYVYTGGCYNRSVLDLGFGYGDILRFFYDMQWHIYGVDKLAYDHYSDYLADLAKDLDKCVFFEDDIVNWINTQSRDAFYDMVICTSVLPYFEYKQQDKILSWIGIHSEWAIIEMQSYGDGPGSNHDLEGQEEIEDFLNTYFRYVTCIGKTNVKDLSHMRKLFLCT